MFNLFKKATIQETQNVQETKEPEVPRWVETLCANLGIRDIPQCSNWHQVQVIYTIILIKAYDDSLCVTDYAFDGKLLKIYNKLFSRDILALWDNKISVKENVENMTNYIRYQYGDKFLDVIDDVNTRHLADP